MQPWPTASTYWLKSDGPVRLIVHRTEVLDDVSGSPGEVIEASGDRLVVAAGEGAVRLLSVQMEGKKEMPVADFLRGHQVRLARFGTPG